ncbi:hypothetical protein FIBSPDRAFT_967959 [Athelia psychrophila]|uniref:C2 domain-containing protein n=1 Tax=Athelia psychrophila TaxID=1759441 RepID=A0A167V4Y0_9AGAM|nr:hypothetical protein FIBSPDRAFT_967959 [Fibularhizoctonia sp. CBS 109695]
MSSRSTKQQRDQNQHDANTLEIVKAQISNLGCTQVPKNQASKKLYVKISSVGDQVPFTTSTVTGDSAVAWADTYTFEAPISSSLEFQVCQHRNFHKDKIIGTFKRTVQSLFQETSSDIRCELWKAGAGGASEKLPTAITFSLANLAQNADVGRLGEEDALSQARGGLDLMTSASGVGAVTQAGDIAAQAVDVAESLGSIWESVLNKLEIFTEITKVIAEVHPYAQTACAVLSAVPKALIAQRDRDEVLAGVAGCGKSAIAHTIAQHYYGTKRLGSSFCFSQADQAARGPGNVLSTIAKDIANLDPQWKLSLYNAVQNDDSLRKTTAPARQMKDLIQEPAKNAPIAGPIVIVIDALDESGDPDGRESLLQVLSKSASELPGNFRILITARQEEDIIEAFVGKPCVQLRYVDAADQVGAKVDADIAMFIEHKLAKIANVLNDRWPNGEWIILLVNASGHLFQWAATACRAILIGLRGYRPAERLENIVKDGRGLDNLYIEILSHTFDVNDERVMARFKLVLGGILVAREPLSMQAHAALQHIGEDEEYVQMVVQPIGSLLHGTAQSDTPILALHASFFDFLKDEGRSKAFFVDPMHLEHRFVLECLGVMKDELRFNICDLPTSYVRNADVPDIQDRVEQLISPHLLYACRFLGAHLEVTPCETRVREELQVFLHERLLFWLEVLSLTKQMSSATRTLASIAKWDEKFDSDLTAFARDAIKFVDVFVPPISQSAPHIYLSALPFAPSESLVSQTYLPRYPFTMHLKKGKLDQWPAELKKFEGHSRPIHCIAYSPDSTHIVSGSEDTTVRVWDAETGMVTVGPLIGHTAAVRCVAYSPDGKCVASGSDDKMIRVWDTETGEMVGSPFKGHNEAIFCIAYSPDGKHMASGSQDKMIQVWDAETGEAVGSPLEGHTDSVFSIAYSPDGKCIASGSGDGTIRVWDAVTGKAVGSPFKGHGDSVWSVAYSPDGKFIASGSGDCTVRVWDAATGKAVGLPLEGHRTKVYSVAYIPGGRHIVSGSRDSTIRVWDVKTGHAVGGPYKGHGSYIRSVACSPDGARIASSSDDCTIRVWDAEIIDREAVEVSLQKPLSDFYSVAYSRDGASIVSGDVNGVIRVWDAVTGKAVGAPFEGHREVVRSIAYSPDGTCIASGSSDKTIRRWDVETGKEVGLPLEGHHDGITSVAYSLDGKCIVSGSQDKTIRIWDAVTGEEMLLIEDCKDEVYSVAYSPDGKCVVSGCRDGVIQVWNAATGEAVGPPIEENTGSVFAIAYSPDGTRIASGSFDSTVRVWDAKTGKAIGSPFKGHSGPVRSVAYSPDGKHIASGSSDSSVRVWDAETGEAVGSPFKVHIGLVTSVAYSPDGTHIVSGSADNTIRIWEVNSVTCTSESATGFTHDSILDNGWITTPSSQLLLWVPSWFRSGLVWPNNTAVVAANLTELDLANFVYIPRVNPQPIAPDPLDPLGLAYALPAELDVILRRLEKNDTTRRALEELKAYVEAGAAERIDHAVRAMLPVWQKKLLLMFSALGLRSRTTPTSTSPLSPPRRLFRILKRARGTCFRFYVVHFLIQRDYGSDKPHARASGAQKDGSAAEEGEGETNRNARPRIGVLGRSWGSWMYRRPLLSPSSLTLNLKKTTRRTLLSSPALWTALNPEPGPEALLFSTPNNPEIKKEKNAILSTLSRVALRPRIESDVGVWHTLRNPLLVSLRTYPAQTQDREGDVDDDQDDGEHDDDQDQDHDREDPKMRPPAQSEEAQETTIRQPTARSEWTAKHVETRVRGGEPASPAHRRGSKLIIVKIDSASGSNAADAVELLRKDHGFASLDVVIANAGIRAPGPPPHSNNVSISISIASPPSPPSIAASQSNGTLPGTNSANRLSTYANTFVPTPPRSSKIPIRAADGSEVDVKAISSKRASPGPPPSKLYAWRARRRGRSGWLRRRRRPTKSEKADADEAERIRKDEEEQVRKAEEEKERIRGEAEEAERGLTLIIVFTVPDLSPPAPEPEQPDDSLEQDQKEDPLIALLLPPPLWSALNPEPGPEALGFSRPPVRRAAWAVVATLVRCWKTPEFKKEKDAILPTLNRVALRPPD